jgi:hypothetical protein
MWKAECSTSMMQVGWVHGESVTGKRLHAIGKNKLIGSPSNSPTLGA